VLGGLWFLLWTRRWRWLGIAPMTAGILLTLSARQPDILIAEDGKLVAFRQENGVMALSNRAHDKFTQSVWVRRAGEGDIEDNPPPLMHDTTDSEHCGQGACRFIVAGHRVATLIDVHGFAAACDSDAEIVISAISAHAHCKAPLVIDRTDLARDGAMAILFDQTGPRIQTVQQDSGNRPWSGRRLSISGSARPAGPAP
jgi:competence protein ComEC